MALMNKKFSDWTPSDVVEAWGLTAIIDIFVMIAAVFMFMLGKKKPRRTKEEILQAQRDDDAMYRREQLLRRD